MTRILQFGLLLIALASSLEITRADEPKPSERSACLIADKIDDDFKNPASVSSKGEIREVLLSTSNVSLPVPVGDDGWLQLVKPVEDPEKNADGKAHEVLVDIRIPEQIKKALVILSRSSKEGEAIYTSHVLDLAEYRNGDLLFANLSPEKLKISMDEEAIELGAGETKVAPFRELTEPKSIALKIERFETDKERWKLFYSSYAAARPTCRGIFIFNWDSKVERITHKSITFEDKVR